MLILFWYMLNKNLDYQVCVYLELNHLCNPPDAHCWCIVYQSCQQNLQYTWKHLETSGASSAHKPEGIFEEIVIFLLKYFLKVHGSSLVLIF